METITRGTTVKKYSQPLGTNEISRRIRLKVVNFIFYSGPQLSHQIQSTHIKYKLITSKTNYLHQIQNPDIKNKIKRSVVGEQKLCPVFTRP